MIPEGITDQHIKLAAAEIDREGIPVHRNSVHYDLVLNGRKYPPKYIISLATRYATGDEHSPEDFNAVEAKNFLENRGYKITDRRSESVKETLNQIFPDKEIRKNCLSILSECIIQADESGSSKWGVHLLKDRVRLLVGSMIVCTIQDGEIWVALDQDKLDADEEFNEILNKSSYWRWDEQDYPEYTRVPSKNGYYRPADQNLELWQSIKAIHLEFIRKVANKFELLQNRSRENHEPELLNYIQENFGISLPFPDHDSFGELSTLEIHDHEFEGQKISETERDSLTRSRIGQGIFRTRLKIFWQNSCSVTGCSTADLLRASHIKPWRDSDNQERLDEFNGLLLTPNLDAAFDSGFISFNNSGSILISKRLNAEQKSALGIDDEMSLRKITDRHRKFLEYHRSYVFKI